MIYFLLDAECDYVKIGFSDSPEIRIPHLQTASPHKLSIITIIRGTLEDEKKWHDDFSTTRVRGEWFQCSRELMSAIANAAVAELQWQLASQHPTLNRWMRCYACYGCMNDTSDARTRVFVGPYAFCTDCAAEATELRDPVPSLEVVR